MLTYMRSNDAYWGLPHDVFAFTMLQEILARSLTLELGTYKHAVVLLAVHASISFADAVLIACLGQRSRDQDHTAAIRDLRALCRTRRIDEKGIAHFSWLLQRKTDFSYGDHPLSGHTEVQLAIVNAERFQTWVYRTFGEVRA